MGLVAESADVASKAIDIPVCFPVPDVSAAKSRGRFPIVALRSLRRRREVTTIGIGRKICGLCDFNSHPDNPTFHQFR